jgi:hypothetical protein
LRGTEGMGGKKGNDLPPLTSTSCDDAGLGDFPKRGEFTRHIRIWDTGKITTSGLPVRMLNQMVPLLWGAGCEVCHITSALACEAREN